MRGDNWGGVGISQTEAGRKFFGVTAAAAAMPWQLILPSLVNQRRRNVFRIFESFATRRRLPLEWGFPPLPPPRSRDHPTEEEGGGEAFEKQKKSSLLITQGGFSRARKGGRRRKGDTHTPRSQPVRQRLNSFLVYFPCDDLGE